MRSAEGRSLCLGLILLVAQSAGAQDRLLDSIVVRPVAAGHGTVVVIRASDASIRVVGTGGGSVVAAMRIKAGPSQAAGALLGETRGTTVFVSVQRRPRAAYLLDVAVPRGVALRIEGENGGTVSVEGVGGPVEITHSNGAVTVTGAIGYALVATSNGPIIAQIDSLDPAATSSFITNNGNVELTLPLDARATFAIEAGLEVISELPLRADGSARQENRRFVVSHLRGGGSPIRIATDNGVVRVTTKRQ
jgi:hypothetical protein